MKDCFPNQQRTTVGQFIQNLVLAYRELKKNQMNN